MNLKFKCYHCGGTNKATIEAREISFMERFWRWFNGQPVEEPEPCGKTFLFTCMGCGRCNRIIPRREED